MKLSDYLKATKIRPCDFAEMIDVSIASVYKYLKGIRPQSKTMLLIIKASKGKVTHEDMGYEVTYKTTRSRRRGNDRKA